MRILIADTQPKVRFALQVLLQRQPDLKVVGEAMDAESLLEQAETVCPDVVLLAWELPGMEMEHLVPILRENCPGILVIALSGRLEAHRAASEIGVDAFVSKSSPPDQLLAAITRCGCLSQRLPSAEPAVTSDEGCQEKRCPDRNLG
jgi:DNA-binding NarL/FixJ family response regulator